MVNLKLNLAIFEPDIPQNTGAMIRICSCFDVDIDIIHPASFVLSERSLNRVAMDYIKNVKISEFDDWKDYMTKRNGRKILLSTRGSKSHYDYSFNQSDNLIVGRESAGVPEYVHQDSDEVLKINMKAGARSLNVATSSAIVISEAIRQLKII